MKNVSQDIERLIVRRLDGALTEDEALQLDRELIRNPDAQRLLEDYARVDEMASAALGEVLGCAESAAAGRSIVGEINASARAVGQSPGQSSRGWRDRYHRGWWLVPGAVAAALLALMIPKPGIDGGGAPLPAASPRLVDSAPASDAVPGFLGSVPSALSAPNTFGRAVQPGTRYPSTFIPSVTSPQRNGSDLMQNASHVPVMRRRTGREVIGVIGDDGNLYWIEVDRTRTIRPMPASHRPGASGAF